MSKTISLQLTLDELRLVKGSLRVAGVPKIHSNKSSWQKTLDKIDDAIRDIRNMKTTTGEVQSND